MAIKDKLIIPVEVPMWAALSLLGSAIYTAGTMNHKMDVLVEQGKKVEVMYERQVQNIEAVKQLRVDVQRLDARVTQLEHNTPLAFRKGE